MDVNNEVFKVSEYEIPPQELKFHHNENEYLPINGTPLVGELRIPFEHKVTYEVNDNGIERVYEVIDQCGKSMFAKNELIIPKEVFVSAYKKYIEKSQ